MSKRGSRGYSPAARNATKVLLPPLIRAAMRRDWRGHEHIPRTGGVILAGNHLSYADWAADALFTHEAGRYPAFLIKSGVFDVTVIGPFLRELGQLPVRRGQADAALVLKEAERSLAAGECVIFYPEGTATRDPDLWPMRARTGVARLALTTGAPVIPVATWGAHIILPYGSKKPRLRPRTTVRIQAGPAVDLSAFEGKPLTRDVLRDATEAIMADIAGLLGEIRGERPPAAPFDPAAARRERARGQAGTSAADGTSASERPGGDGPRRAAPT